MVAGGSVLVLHRGEPVFEGGFGFADIASRTPFRIDSPAVIASISKPLLGTAAYRLAEQEKINLVAPVSDYLPEFAGRSLESGGLLKRAPTTTELFTHTSGIRHDEAGGGRPWFAAWTAGKPLADVVGRYAREYPFKAQPGTSCTYSGIGTDVAAGALEVAAGCPRNELLITVLTKPLDMTRTFYRDAASLERIGVMPTRYHRGKDGMLLVSPARRVPPTNTYSSSGGSIISTAPDLARWLLMIRNKGRHGGKAFLTADTVSGMLSGFPRSSNARGGLFIRRRNQAGAAVVVGHTGSSGTNCWIDFERDVIGIMLTQTRGKDIRPFRIGLEERITACFAEPQERVPAGR